MMLLKGFKFILFFQFPWLTRLIMFFLISVFLMNNIALALDAKTVEVIHGSAPYFINPDAIGINGSREYNQQNFHYFGVKLQNTINSELNSLNDSIKSINFPQVDPNTTTPNQLLTMLKSDYGFEPIIMPFSPTNPIDSQNVSDDDGDDIAKINPPD